MKKTLTIPTLLGLLLLLLGLGTGIYLLRQGANLTLFAGSSSIPQQVKITNITEGGFSVSWITDKESLGFLKYGPTADTPLTAADDRNQISATAKTYLTHHITVRDLKPAATYFFRIGMGERLFTNNGQPYQISTAPLAKAPPPASDIAYGTIVDQNGAPVEGAIIYLSLANTTPLSALSKASGSWMIPLNLARSTDLSAFSPYDRQASIEEIFVQVGNRGTATAVTTTRNDSPVPTITLGKNHDFRSEITYAGTPSPTPTSGSQFSPPPLATPSYTLTIFNPKEGERINTQRPEFYGTGPAGENITIEVRSPGPASASAQIDSTGNWRWTPPANLEPGSHTVTIRLAKGTVLTRSFVVLAAGDSQIPAQTATESATTPSPTPSPSPTATPTTPPGRVSLPSTQEGTPIPGNLTPTFYLFIMGLALLLLGLFINQKHHAR